VLSGLQDIPQGEQLAILLAEAEWQQPAFIAMISDVVDSLNGSADTISICSKYGLDADVFYLPLRSEKLQLSVDGSAGLLVRPHFGPPKSPDRAAVKGVEWLMDLNRVTLEFEDPFVLALAYHMLNAEHKQMVTAVKNKFLQEKFTQPPCVHLIIDMDGWKVEVMLILSDFLEIKHEMHKVYEILRAQDPGCILKPIYDL